jgi:hypothetical protein
MTQHSALTEALATAVRDVPGVAFLKPGIARVLRSALPRSDRTGASEPPAGLRISRPGGTGPWVIEVQIVTRTGTRALDITRATRRAVEACLASRSLTEAAHITVTVTVTGII